jgi:hypothetical protein
VSTSILDFVPLIRTTTLGVMPPEPTDIIAPSMVVTVVMVRSARSGVTAATAATSRIPASRRIVKSPRP